MHLGLYDSTIYIDNFGALHTPLQCPYCLFKKDGNEDMTCRWNHKLNVKIVE